MTAGAPPGDVLGFSREARGFGAGVCLAAMLALSEEMSGEGIVGDPAELSRRYAQIRSFARACPAAGAAARRIAPPPIPKRLPTSYRCSHFDLPWSEGGSQPRQFGCKSAHKHMGQV
jgi:hypothetical protein